MNWAECLHLLGRVGGSSAVSQVVNCATVALSRPTRCATAGSAAAGLGLGPCAAWRRAAAILLGETRGGDGERTCPHMPQQKTARGIVALRDRAVKTRRRPVAAEPIGILEATAASVPQHYCGSGRRKSVSTTRRDRLTQQIARDIQPVLSADRIDRQDVLPRESSGGPRATWNCESCGSISRSRTSAPRTPAGE